LPAMHPHDLRLTGACRPWAADLCFGLCGITN
jgi:hypothetical protein